MADDKLKTGPESPVLDHPGGGPAGRNVHPRNMA